LSIAAVEIDAARFDKLASFRQAAWSVDGDVKFNHVENRSTNGWMSFL
jgi:hypothetical protein